MLLSDYLSEIRSVNLSYLMIASQLIRHDRAEAIFRLGINADVADIIVGMNNNQLLKLAESNIMLARFRFEDSKIFASALKNKNGNEFNPSHVDILLSGKKSEVVT